MYTTTIQKAPVRWCKKNSRTTTNSLVNFFRKTLPAMALCAFSFASHGQSISIGSPMDATEGSGIISFIVSLDNGAINTTGSAITGDISLSGTATPTVDYNGPSSFSIAPGASSIGILVPVIDDTDIEPTETVIFTISNLSAGTIGNASAIANIFDDDSGSSLSLSIGSPVSGGEGGGGNVSFTVQLDLGNINNTGSAITGTLSYAGTATNGSDFVASSLFTIQNGNNSTTINIAIIEDLLLECDETIIATISNPSGGATVSATGSTSTAIITDNECLQSSISISAPASVTEGGGSPLEFIVSLDGGVVNATGSAITGNISYGGSANDPSDYIGVSTFSIPDGASSTTISLVVVNDAVIEATETVVASISNLSNGTIGNGSASANIFDDDAGSLIISINSPIDATEGTSDVSFDIEIVAGGASAVPITGTIDYAGGATVGVDYVPVYSYTIPAGSTSTTVTLQVIDDAITEPTEPIAATLTGSPSIGTYANTTSTANIFDDDASNLSISIGSPTDGTEGSAFVTYTISLDGGAVNTTGTPIFGAIAYTGTATDGADYTGTALFTIPNGVGSTLIILPVIDDVDVECDETVIATISSPSVGTIGIANSTAIIFDDECAQGATTLSIVSPVNGFEGVSDASFIVALDNGFVNGTGAPITGSVSYSGTATASTDYTEILTFSIPDGSSFTTLVLPVIDDLNIECDETIVATISNPSVGTINVSTESAIIEDDECSQFLISIGQSADGSESGTDVSFQVFLEGGLINGTGSAIMGDISFAGTATEGTDYTSGPIGFSIADGASFAQISLSVIDDAIVEGTETVTATISNPSLGSIGTGTETANILDNDSTSGIDPITLIDLTIYPNPVESILFIEADQQIKSYSILDLNGRLVASGEVNAKELELTTNDLTSGAYVLQIRFEGGNTINRKILKK